jgi:hypothetical protein
MFVRTVERKQFQEFWWRSGEGEMRHDDMPVSIVQCSQKFQKVLFQRIEILCTCTVAPDNCSYILS